MKRRLFTILLFLLLGAVVNVALAWVLVFATTLQGFDRDWSGEIAPKSYRGAIILAEGSGTNLYWFEWIGLAEDLRSFSSPAPVVPNWAWKRVDRAKASSEHGNDLFVHARGWPCRSMFCEVDCDTGLITRGLALSPDEPSFQTMFAGDYALPFGVIPFGLAVNTLFYAFLLWLPICGPFALRRQIRRRRGCCLKCGYTAGKSPTCTECGASLPARKEQA